MAKKINSGYDAYGKLKPKKVNLDENPSNVNLKKLHDRDKGKVPLQITPTLMILVAPERANAEYAQEYREKMEYNACKW